MPMVNGKKYSYTTKGKAAAKKAAAKKGTNPKMVGLTKPSRKTTSKSQKLQEAMRAKSTGKKSYITKKPKRK